MTQVIEILLYTLKPGTGAAFFDIMQRSSVPLQQQNGIDVVWHGQSLHNPDGYGLIRAFADLPAMEAALAAFYASDPWRNGPRQAIIERIETATNIVIRVDADAVAPIRKQGIAAIGHGPAR